MTINTDRMTDIRYEDIADTLFMPIYPFLYRDVVAALNCESLCEFKVLEIGGGPGHMAEQFLLRGVSLLVESDISEPMLTTAIRRIGSNAVMPGFLPCCADACRLPFLKGSFDLVFSRGSVMFWHDLDEALSEIGRVLAKGGAAWIGGGYGLSTPSDVKAEIDLKRKERIRNGGDRFGFPRIDYNDLKSKIEALGGRSTLFVDNPGFWILWFPHS